MNLLKLLHRVCCFVQLAAILPLAVAQLPDAPSVVKQREAQRKLPFCEANPFSPSCIVFLAKPEVPEYVVDTRPPLSQPTFCDVNPLLPVCPGFIPSVPPREYEVALRRRLVIEDGTRVQLRLSNTLNSKSVKPGDPVELEVTEDVKIHGAVVIPRYAHAWATLDSGTRKASNVGVDFARFVWTGKSEGNGGRLVLELNGLWAITGETIHLRGWAETRGEDGYVPAEAGVFGLGLMFLTKGENIEVPRGTKITAYVDGNVSLDEALVRRIVPYTERDRQREYAAQRKTSIVHVYRASASRACSESTPNVRSDDLDDNQTSRTQLVPQSELFCPENGQNYGGKPRIFLDGKEVARLAAGRYASLEIPAGDHTLRTDDNEVALLTHPGSEDYLRMQTRGIFKAKGRLELVDEHVGEDAVFGLKPAAAKHVNPERRWVPLAPKDE